LEALHAKGLLSARERLDTLFVEGTFQELGLHASHSATNFGMARKRCPPTA
jgi:propionyl-CoA carboxylase beta chain